MYGVRRSANAFFASFIVATLTGHSPLTGRCPPPQFAHFTDIACPRVKVYFQVGYPSAQWPHLLSMLFHKVYDLERVYISEINKPT